MKQLNMYFLLQIAVLAKLLRYSALIEQSLESHPGSVFLVTLIIKIQCIIFHHLRVNINYLAIH